MSLQSPCYGTSLQLRHSTYLLHFDTGPFAADPAEERRFAPLIIMFPFLSPLLMHAPPRQFTLPRFSLTAARPDGSVFQWSGTQCHMIPSRQQQLQNLSVVQALYSFSIDVCDEVPWSHTRLKRWTSIIHRLQYIYSTLNILCTFMN
jgi:hypothetical protein